MANAPNAQVITPPLYPTSMEECRELSNKYTEEMHQIANERDAIKPSYKQFRDAGICCHEWAGKGAGGWCNVPAETVHLHSKWYCLALEKHREFNKCTEKVREYKKRMELTKKVIKDHFKEKEKTEKPEWEKKYDDVHDSAKKWGDISIKNEVAKKVSGAALEALKITHKEVLREFDDSINTLNQSETKYNHNTSSHYISNKGNGKYGSDAKDNIEKEVFDNSEKFDGKSHNDDISEKNSLHYTSNKGNRKHGSDRKNDIEREISDLISFNPKNINGKSHNADAVDNSLDFDKILEDESLETAGLNGHSTSSSPKQKSESVYQKNESYETVEDVSGDCYTDMEWIRPKIRTPDLKTAPLEPVDVVIRRAGSLSSFISTTKLQIEEYRKVRDSSTPYQDISESHRKHVILMEDAIMISEAYLKSGLCRSKKK